MTRASRAIVLVLPLLLLLPRVYAQVAQQRQARLTGIVIADDTGMPVAGANVRVGDRTARTNEQGNFEVTGLGAGRYVVTAAFRGYVTTAPGQRRAEDPRVPIELTEGSARDVEIRLIPLGLIAGQILREDGSPASKVSVRAVRQMPLRTIDTIGVTAVTDNDGRFTLRGLQTGRYYVIAETRPGKVDAPNANLPLFVGDASAMTAYYPGTAFPDQARTIEISAGAIGDATFPIARTRLARVTGRVVDSTGRAPTDFIVLPISRPPQPMPPGSMSLKTDADGRFEVTGLPPGEYSIDVLTKSTFFDPDGSPSERQVDDGPAGGFASHRFRVSGEDVEDLVLRMAPGFSITGTIGGPGVRMDQGKTSVSADPPEDLLSAAFSPRRAVVKPDGRFEIKNVRGPYVLRVTELPAGQMVTQILADGVDVIDSGIDVTRNTEVEIVLGRQSELTGRVTDARGRIVTSAAVVVFAEDPARWPLTETRYVRTVAVRDDGTFSVSGLPSGRYYVAARRSDPGAPTSGTDDLDALIAGATRTQIRVGEASSVNLRVE